MKPLMTIEETCAALRVCEKTLGEYRKSHPFKELIKCYKFSRKNVLFCPDSITKFRDACHVR